MTQKFGLLFGAAAMVATSFALPVPAVAQGTVGPVPKNGMCPSGWNDGPYVRGTPSKTCYPNSGSSKPIYARSGGCADGYGADGNYCVKGLVKGGNVVGPPATASIAKANPRDRCPLSYTSDDALEVCNSAITNPPATRAKGAGACRAGELEEWGLYCTSKYAGVTVKQALVAQELDIIAITTWTGKSANQGDEFTNTPTIVKLFGVQGKYDAASDSHSGTSSPNTAAAAPAKPQPNCPQQGSAEGAALGGAVAGEAGAAIGAMLGGFGKRKKPAGC